MKFSFLLVVGQMRFKLFETFKRPFDPVVASSPDGTESPHEGKVFRNDQIPLFEFQDIQKRPAHACVGGHTSLKTDGFNESPPFADVALKIPGQGIAESRDDVVVGRGDLLEMNHVRLGKDAATSSNSGGIL